MLILEIVAEDIPCALCDATLPKLAIRVFCQTVIQRLTKPNRRVRRSIENMLDRIIVRDDTPVSLSILLRKFRELITGPFKVAPLSDPCAIRERNVNNWIRKNIFKTVLTKLEFVIAKGGAALNEYMCGGA